MADPNKMMLFLSEGQPLNHSLYDFHESKNYSTALLRSNSYVYMLYDIHKEASVAELAQYLGEDNTEFNHVYEKKMK